MKKERILGVEVSDLGYKDLERYIISDIENSKKSFIVAINPEKVMKARKDKNLAKALHRADYPIADGIGIIIASKLKKGNIKNRVTGIDCMDMIFSLSNERGYKIFLYGARKEVLAKAKEKILNKYPNLKIVGTIDGYEQDNEKIVSKVNSSGADILFVALGSPKQENWISSNKKRLCAKVYMGVGGSLDVFSGAVKRAPDFMQKFGFEWLFRLINEPKRLFRQVKLLKFMALVVFCKTERKEKNIEKEDIVICRS